MTAQNRLQSTSEPLRPRALKTASREIFRKSRASQGRSAAYRFGASRENAHAYENVRQDRQSLQTDPVGYDIGLNLFAYVQNDPLNWTDPLGLANDDDDDDDDCEGEGCDDETIVVAEEEVTFFIPIQVWENAPLGPVCTNVLPFQGQMYLTDVNGVTIEAFAFSPWTPEFQAPGRMGPGNQSTNGPTTNRTGTPAPRTSRPSGARGVALVPGVVHMSVTLQVYPLGGGLNTIQRGVSGSYFGGPKVSVDTPDGSFVGVTAAQGTHSTEAGYVTVCVVN